jgi:hypothetical protein
VQSLASQQFVLHVAASGSSGEQHEIAELLATCCASLPPSRTYWSSRFSSTEPSFTTRHSSSSRILRARSAATRFVSRACSAAWLSSQTRERARGLRPGAPQGRGLVVGAFAPPLAARFPSFSLASPLNSAAIVVGLSLHAPKVATCWDAARARRCCCSSMRNGRSSCRRAATGGLSSEPLGAPQNCWASEPGFARLAVAAARRSPRDECRDRKTERQKRWKPALGTRASDQSLLSHRAKQRPRVQAARRTLGVSNALADASKRRAFHCGPIVTCARSRRSCEPSRPVSNLGSEANQGRRCGRPSPLPGGPRSRLPGLRCSCMRAGGRRTSAREQAARGVVQVSHLVRRHALAPPSQPCPQRYRARAPSRSTAWHATHP